MQAHDKLGPAGRAHLAAGAICGLLLMAWELASRCSVDIAFFLSRPTQVWHALVEMATYGNLVGDIGITAGEALLGTGAGTVLGSAVGLALWLSRRAARVAAPFIVVLANFPIFALAPAAIVWLGIGVGMKVFLAAFSTFFVSLNLAHQGAKLAQEQFGGVFDGFRATRWDTYRKVVVPGALGAVFSSMRINVGLGLLGAFIGEFIASERGLGHAIIRASSLYQIDRVFAAVLCIVVLAALFDRLAYGVQQENLFLARRFGLPQKLHARTRELISRQSGDR